MIKFKPGDIIMFKKDANIGTNREEIFLELIVSSKNRGYYIKPMTTSICSVMDTYYRTNYHTKDSVHYYNALYTNIFRVENE